jgi:hypothetical protein
MTSASFVHGVGGTGAEHVVVSGVNRRTEPLFADFRVTWKSGSRPAGVWDRTELSFPRCGCHTRTPGRWMLGSHILIFFNGFLGGPRPTDTPLLGTSCMGPDPVSGHDAPPLLPRHTIGFGACSPSIEVRSVVIAGYRWRERRSRSRSLRH